MDRKQVSDAYVQTSIATASAKDIAVLLLQEALKCIKKAKSALEKPDHFERNEQLKRAQQCVSEIIPYLNEEAKEGQVTAAVYRHVYNLLIQANSQKSAADLIEAEEIIASLVKAWQESRKN